MASRSCTCQAWGGPPRHDSRVTATCARARASSSSARRCAGSGRPIARCTSGQTSKPGSLMARARVSDSAYRARPAGQACYLSHDAGTAQCLSTELWRHCRVSTAEDSRQMSCRSSHLRQAPSHERANTMAMPNRSARSNASLSPVSALHHTPVKSRPHILLVALQLPHRFPVSTPVGQCLASSTKAVK